MSTSPKENMPNPFHDGEMHVQERMGVRDSLDLWARKAIRPFMPDQHRIFYQQLPFMVASARDSQGRPWATMLAGSPGFVQSPDAESLTFSARLDQGDALAGSLNAGVKVGLLGIELDTRRRNRINGTLVASDESGFSISVDQSFGNCPQYIAKRFWHSKNTATRQSSAKQSDALSASMMTWINDADTLFIASGFVADQPDNRSGMDVSHRGGLVGFIRVNDESHLVLPDYSGNNFFNTIGNLVKDPRVGLLFVDFERGGMLQITGRATIDWDSHEVAKFAGAQRLIHIDIDAVVELRNTLPLRWTSPEKDSRELRVSKKTIESDDVISFYFSARDGSVLPKFKAGQHLPVEVFVNQDESLERTYSLSNDAHSDHYRISVKREPHGSVSRVLHDEIQEGDILRAKTPSGDFILSDSARPVVLISAGIGVTPMVSMLHSLIEIGRPVSLMQGVRDGHHNPLANEIRETVATAPEAAATFFFSQPRADDILGQHYDVCGHIGLSDIQSANPGLDAEFYICGPGVFQSSLMDDLISLGVDEDRIYIESF